MPEKEKTKWAPIDTFTVIWAVALVVVIVFPVATSMKSLPTENQAAAAGIQAGYSLQYLPEDVDVVIVHQCLNPEGPERALDEIKRTRTVREVIAVGDSEYIVLLERARYLP
jgi:hypothetical protein